MTHRAIDVSVPLVTYNHAAFVRQAMESVLAQETSYAWELVVGDDCSTDGTEEIVRAIAALHPERVRVLESASNLGAHRNFERTVGACRGRYLALLEGDDYWCDPAKIEKQARYLDRNPGVALTGGGVLVWSETEKKTVSRIAEKTGGLRGLEDILRTNCFSTCAVMIRRESFILHPKLASLAVGDWPLWILAATKGQLHASPEILATYRLNPAGAWSSKSPAYAKRVIEEMFSALREILPADESISRALEDGRMAFQVSATTELLRRRMYRDWMRELPSLAPAVFRPRHFRQLLRLLAPLAPWR
jgi:glycosyltransferase involved in cell wall biosynthesis